ncbi:hypothetical protein LPB140_09820 [Sphingorhabdus lutea]|uniref:EamA domain-containing protein n=2 Tax=Sphingorhabdus lutea TaxID=1913578 RepID=A0A1L3JF49_9SPHN|nr:hypothetical protein LPB140_09820 [Sphingorhabdus lutea]
MPHPNNVGENILLGILLRLGATIMIIFMFAGVKMAAARGVNVGESLFWRQLAGLPIVIIWLYFTHELSSIKTNRPMAHGIRMLLGLSAMVLNYLAMSMMAMAEATIISFTIPIFATIFAMIILKEKTGPYRWAAVIVGFIGILLVIRPSMAIFQNIGALVALGGALMTAAVTIQIRSLGKTENAGTIVFWFSLTSMLPLTIVMFMVAKPHNADIYWIILFLSICGAIAQILLTAAMRYAPVAIVLTMDYVAIIWSSLIGYFIFDERISNHLWLGAVIIIGAGIFISWREHYVKSRLK